ncbi:MAG: VOC family protein [Limnobaculum xujianqingii]
MTQQVYINLAVQDLPRSVQFFTQLGFSFNPQFTDENATCMIVSDSIYVMLLTQARFSDFAPKAICNSHEANEVLICLSCESREAVDSLVEKAINAGGNTYNQPQDHGFMYGHGFTDPDGHVWELAYMDMSQLPG